MCSGCVTRHFGSSQLGFGMGDGGGVIDLSGSNAILAFILSQLIGDYSDKPWAIRATAFAALHAVIPNANAASFSFAVVNLLLIVAILAPLHHRRIFLRL